MVNIYYCKKKVLAYQKNYNSQDNCFPIPFILQIFPLVSILVTFPA